MKKKKVVVLMGGKSSEYEVSLKSGNEVIRNLDKSKYVSIPIVIPKKGKFDVKAITDKRPDIVFLALHGPFGEDGCIQGMLEVLGIPYTGSGVLASSIGMDKAIFRRLMTSWKIAVPKYIEVKKNDNLKNISEMFKKFPLFIKPHNQGSSVGMSIVESENQLLKAIQKAFEYSEIALVDEYIDGSEFTCAILGNDHLRILPIIEIKPNKGAFFDYESKYSIGGAEEIVPAKIPVSLSSKISEISKKVYLAVGCRGFARIDFLFSKNKLYVLEINTIPGLTPFSLFPKTANAAGISYSKLIDKIIGYALE